MAMDEFNEIVRREGLLRWRNDIAIKILPSLISGYSPEQAAQVAWQYAEAMVNQMVEAAKKEGFVEASCKERSRRRTTRGGARVKLYVVAISQKEAEEVAEMICHAKRPDAERHLAEVKAPPTDPYYASQYKIFTVDRMIPTTQRAGGGL